MEDPTPCPGPRHGLGPARRRQSSRPSLAPQHHGSDQPSTKVLAMDDYIVENNTICLDFAKVKPRRPRMSRQSFTWDPSADIYEDVTACQPTLRGIKLPVDEHGDRTLSIAPLARDRRSSLLAQPAQRPFKDGSFLAGSTTSDLKRSRSSLAPPSVPTQHHRSSVHSQKSQPPSTIEKDLRRRTIWVPSEDTTIMTIHPGASLNDHRAPSKKMRRSDIFLDLAEVVEEEEDRKKSEVTMPSQSGSDGLSRPARRMSLAAAPRKAPLRQSMRPMQTLSTIVDVPGSDTGKENVPPASTTHTASKPGRRPSIAVKLLAAADDSCGFRSSSVSEKTLTRTLQPEQPGTAAKEHFLRSSVQKDQTTTSSSRTLHSASQRSRYSIDSTSLVARAAMTANKRVSGGSFATAPPTRLSVPVVAFNKSHSEMFPVLHEDITKPDMYEDNWLGQQETAISQVLNCLFEKAGNHTGVTRSLGFDMRAALLTVYNGTPFSLLYKRLKASLLYGALSIPKEVVNQSIRIKDDLAQRRRFLDLWVKTYELSHLQAAAEVVVGRQIPQSPRNSASGSPSNPMTGAPHASPRAIEAFLKTFLVFNEDKTPRGGRRETTIDGSLTAAYHVRDWQHTVLRSLMLVTLLDQAKDKAHTPGLLFKVASPYKSSAAVLQGLSKLLLPSVGDVMRVLGHLDYHVSSAQYPLQEREYAIINLAVDLRDGVLLTRLVELLLYPPASLALQGQDVTVTLPSGDILTAKDDGSGSAGWVLSQHLKYPCNGRAQKVYNAQIALSALHGVKGFEGVLDSITAEHIVDGHREKTLGLLWSLVGRWGLEMLLDADMVQHEIARLRAARDRENISSDDTGDFEVDLPCLQGLDKYNYLLKTWAKEVALRRGRHVSNLSTAFTDGAVFEAVVELYRPCLSSEAGTCSTHSESVAATLKSLGCSQAFISLFRAGSISVPSPQTVIPQLAFLAARLLPAARPYHAALTLQRAWRHAQAWTTLRRRLRLAQLAHACAIVVHTRERLIWATVTLQRQWKAQLLRRPRHERPV